MPRHPPPQSPAATDTGGAGRAVVGVDVRWDRSARGGRVVVVRRGAVVVVVVVVVVPASSRDSGPGPWAGGGRVETGAVAMTTPVSVPGSA